MVQNVAPRPRHYASLMRRLSSRAGIATQGAVWELGERTFMPLSSSDSAPGSVPDLIAEASTSAKRLPVDAFLYGSGRGSFADFRFRREGSSLNGVLVLRARIALVFPKSSTFAEQKDFFEVLSEVLAAAAKRVNCFATLNTSSGTQRVAAILSFGLLSCTLPSAGDDEVAREEVNRYLRRMRPSPFGPFEIPPILRGAEVEAERQRLRAQIESNLASLRRLRERNAVLREQPPTEMRDLEIGLNENLIATGERKNEELDADLAGLSAPEDGGTFLAQKAYDDFVASFARGFPPHIWLVVGTAHLPAMAATPQMAVVRTEAKLTRTEQRRSLKKAILGTMGLTHSFSRPTLDELQAFLTGILSADAVAVDEVSMRSGLETSDS